MIRHARARMLIKASARALGFQLLNIRPYLQRVSGEPTNLQWYEVRLHCPCGRPKLLHVQHASLPQLDAELRAHLQRDGLLPQ
jgi:DNA-binding transcriptional MerR regulator